MRLPHSCRYSRMAPAHLLRSSVVVSKQSVLGQHYVPRQELSKLSLSLMSLSSRIVSHRDTLPSEVYDCKAGSQSGPVAICSCRSSQTSSGRNKTLSTSSFLSSSSNRSSCNPTYHEFIIPGRACPAPRTGPHTDTAAGPHMETAAGPHTDTAALIKEAMLRERIAAHEESLDDLYARATRTRGRLERYV